MPVRAGASGGAPCWVFFLCFSSSSLLLGENGNAEAPANANGEPVPATNDEDALEAEEDPFGGDDPSLMAKVIMTVEPLEPKESAGCYFFDVNSWKYTTHPLEPAQPGGSSSSSAGVGAGGDRGSSKKRQKENFDYDPFADAKTLDMSLPVVHLNAKNRSRIQASFDLPVPELSHGLNPLSTENWLLLLEPSGNAHGTKTTTYLDNLQKKHQAEISFCDPGWALQRAAGVPLLTISNRSAEGEYPSHNEGYSLWAKYEFKTLSGGDCVMRAFTHLGNPAMASNLRLTFLVRQESKGVKITKRIFSTAFLPLFNVSIPKKTETLLVLLEANLAEPARECEYSINLFEQKVGMTGRRFSWFVSVLSTRMIRVPQFAKCSVVLLSREPGSRLG